MRAILLGLLLLPLFSSFSLFAADDAIKVKTLYWDQMRPPISEEIKKRFDEQKITPVELRDYLQELGLKVLPELNGQLVRIPGYLVPLAAGDAGKATEFLLVPTVGACIHTPPPPANQMVYMKYAEGKAYSDKGWEPFWVYGVLKASSQKTEYAEALYSIDVTRIEAYEPEIK